MKCTWQIESNEFCAPLQQREPGAVMNNSCQAEWPSATQRCSLTSPCITTHHLLFTFGLALKCQGSYEPVMVYIPPNPIIGNCHICKRGNYLSAVTAPLVVKVRCMCVCECVKYTSCPIQWGKTNMLSCSAVRPVGHCVKTRIVCFRKEIKQVCEMSIDSVFPIPLYIFFFWGVHGGWARQWLLMCLSEIKINIELKLAN